MGILAQDPINVLVAPFCGWLCHGKNNVDLSVLTLPAVRPPPDRDRKAGPNTHHCHLF